MLSHLEEDAFDGLFGVADADIMLVEAISYQSPKNKLIRTK
jgi:hypothetical protein